MAGHKRAIKGERNIAIDFGTVNPKQAAFLDAKTFFVC